MRQKRRLAWIIAVLFLLLASLGMDFSVVTLYKKPEIDLDEAINHVPVGKQGKEDSAPSVNEATPSEDKAVPPEDKADNKPKSISVRGHKITYGGLDYPDAKALKEKLGEEIKGEFAVELKDMYADARTYYEVLRILRELEKERGLSYQAD
ncbi:MAG: hypothetical protein K6F35_05990 [Lachnospiraceae bacterium]|nr:hypothetical protein [Lachnospiraceae bacterium]